MTQARELGVTRYRRRGAGQVRQAAWRATATVVAIVAAMSSADLSANDSTVELGAGGLDFIYNPDVEMRSEDLSISTAQVRVIYRFFNRSDRDITSLVAFPMPDITIDSPDANISVPTEDPVNFLAFETTANGHPVTTNVEQKVIARGVDRTAMLGRLGIPLAPHLRATYAALDALPKAEWWSLIDIGLAEIDEYGTGANGGMEQHLEPRWTLKTTYYWQQTFPAKQELLIEHRYRPSVGASAGSSVGADYPADLHAYQAKYCMDSAFVAAARRARQAAARAKNTYVGERRIDYILKTGANWGGAIGDFVLTVDKGRPDNLVSFCAHGVEKISPTAFRVHYRDFTPTGDLAVLILTTNADP